ncbi:glutathione transferase GstA [Legionella feeleii]|uniref:Glutathione S-transferase n=1 Tax=Legionella feeleii TaxID=453 RepID=A0A0W0TH42_9GAMM|nr:glutathione transferase GstA [Legionella feeleii]KTC94945.1 glutathione S-transferase [Legionella feeleii]SPX60803.1 glutathione S-transferase [Legionella feeleii]
MKLFFARGACSLVIRIIINEIGLKCDYVSVDLKTKKTEDNKDYLAINPKGAVPALQLDDGEIITENLVIQQYLVDEYKADQLCPPIGDINRYQILSWSNYITTELHKSFGALFNPAITQELKDKIYIPAIKQKLEFIDKQLAQHRYLAGNHFTLPDAYLFVMLTWSTNFKIDLTEYSHLPGYFQELHSRESIMKSLKEEGFA